MLGMNEANLNANKANRIMRKKIQFMINDENVAEDFLDLVDQLKHIKSKNHAKFVSEVNKARDEAGKDLLMSNIFNNGFLLLSDEVEQMKDAGNISKADIAWLKRQQAIKRKQDIEAMAQQRAVANLQRKERRKELQEKILGDIKERGRSIVFLQKWASVIMLHKAFRRFQREVRRKASEAEYFQKVMWTVIRARRRIQYKIRRQGPTAEERMRRTIKNSLISFSSMADFTKYQAGERIWSLLWALKTRRDLRRTMLDFHEKIRRIKVRFKQHFQVKHN